MRFVRGFSVLLLATAAGCAGGAAEPAPRAIDPAVDACAYCSMGVAAERAAQWIAADGVVYTFDEPGCMVQWLAQGEQRGVGFVADEVGSGWVGADVAWYVRDALRTPMGWNVLAFRDRSAAEEFAARHPGARVQDWAALKREGVRHEHTH